MHVVNLGLQYSVNGAAMLLDKHDPGMVLSNQRCLEI